MAPDLLIWLLGKPESTDGRVLSWPFSLTAEIAGNHFLTGRFFRGEVVEDDAVLEISPARPCLCVHDRWRTGAFVAFTRVPS